MAEQVSIRQQLLDNLGAKLVDGDKIKKLYRSLTRAVQADDLPVCALFPVEEITEHSDHDDGGGLHRTLTVHIVYIAAKQDADESSPLDQMVDSAAVWIEQKVGEDETLGGLGFHTHIPRIQWQFESGEFGFVGALFEVEIEYFTLDDPSVSNP